MLSKLGVVVILVLQICFGLWFNLQFGSTATTAIWIGLMWVGVSITTGLFFRSGVNSWLAGTALLAWQILLMGYCWQQPAIRYVLLFGMFALGQHLIDHLLRIPRPAISDQEDLPRAPNSFSIRGVMLLTTCIAVLLAAYRAYAREATSLEVVLLGLPLLILLRVLLASAILAKSGHGLRLAAAVVTTLGGSLLHAWIAVSIVSTSGGNQTLREFLLALQTLGEERYIWLQQLFTILTFVCGCTVLFALGRIDAEDANRSAISQTHSAASTAGR